MRRSILLGLAALGLLACSVPAFAAGGINCDKTAIYDTNTNGATVMITGVANRTIEVCGYHILAAGTATVKFVRGTGTTCGTNEVALTPAWSLTTQVGVGDASGVSRGMMVAPSIDLCIKTSAGVSVQAIIYYSQR